MTTTFKNTEKFLFDVPGWLTSKSINDYFLQ